MPMIEIWDGGVRLEDVLEAVPMTDELKWSIMQFWGVARDDDLDLVSLEQQAAGSPTGLELAAGQLRDLASHLLQFVDGIVVGYRNDPPTRSDIDLRASGEVVIEAIDSTFWRIYADDRAVVDAVRFAYDDVRTVEPEVALPPVHTES